MSQNLNIRLYEKRGYCDRVKLDKPLVIGALSGFSISATSIAIDEDVEIIKRV
jgi:hypothetical protein